MLLLIGQRVVEPRQHLARDEDAGRETAAEEFLRHLAVGRGPEWPRALHRSRREVRRDANAEHERGRREVLQIAEDQRLLRRRQRPERDVVAELRVVEEAGEPDQRAVPVEVISRIDSRTRPR